MGEDVAMVIVDVVIVDVVEGRSVDVVVPIVPLLGVWRFLIGCQDNLVVDVVGGRGVNVVIVEFACTVG